MNNNDTNEVVEPTSASEETELSHSDKMIGILSEPTKTFESISKFPPRTIDWLLPVFIISIVAIISFMIMMNNNQVKLDFENKIIPKIENKIQTQIDSGKITKEKAEISKEIALKWAKYLTYPSKFIAPWLILFFSALIYWLIIKFGFKTEATYTGTLVALGLPYYIITIESILTVIIAYLTGHYLNTLNLAEILGMEMTTFPGLLLSFVDIFMIWYFIIVSIGFIKINHAISITKYYILTFGLWIVLLFIIFAIS